MNATLLSINSNDEISSIMAKKFASKLKPDTSYYFSQQKNEINIIPNKEEENNKLNKMSYIFPSIPEEKIENMLQNNKNISIDEGIKQLKELTLSENLKKMNDINSHASHAEINTNSPSKNKFSFFDKDNIYKKRTKRNYNLLLSQTHINRQPCSNNNININLNISNKSTININNNNINNYFNRLGLNINNNNNELNKNRDDKEKEIERKKLELKSIDKAAEELLNSKNGKDLRDYLFIQLVLLETKKEKDRKIQKIQNKINELDNDFKDLDKCFTTIIRPINKKISVLNKKTNEIKGIEEDIENIKKRIKYYELIGTHYLNLKKRNQNYYY